jgi:hypothetical protein
MTEDNGIRGRIILGSGRSGTTWVQDCLAEANRLRPIFEPLHEGESALGERYAYRMIAAEDENEELERYFLDLSEGRIRSLWIDYRGRKELLLPHPRRFSSVSALRGYLHYWKRYLLDGSKLRSGSHRESTLIKCIRANLMAGWLARTLGLNTVLLVRHPCASVESQYRSGAVWNPEPVAERYRSDARLHDATDGVYLPLLSSRLTTLQALTLNWVIENQAPVSRASAEGYTVAYYEDLRARPLVAWPSICKALELSEVPSKEMLEVPSQQSYENDSGRVLAAGEPRWRRAFSADQLSEIQGILDTTECDLYNVSSYSPLRVSAPLP